MLFNGGLFGREAIVTVPATPFVDPAVLADPHPLLAELRESVAALELALTPAESRWLDLAPGTEEP